MWPVLRVGGHVFRTYGLLVSAAYLAGALYLSCNRENMRVPTRIFWSLCYTLLFGALTGAKLGFWIVEWRTFRLDPSWMLRHWKVGWVFWFGFLTAMLMGWIYQLIYNRIYRPRRYLPVADYFAAALSLGHVIGRLGCFAEGCCHGRPTKVPWAVRFTNPAASVKPDFRGVPLHPVQLYESAGELILFLLITLYILPNIRRKRFAHGTAFLGYIALYSALRFSMECFRGDNRGMFLWAVLSPSQWISAAAFLMTAILLYHRGILERNPQTRSIYL